jgi:hypothetical protein
MGQKLHGSSLVLGRSRAALYFEFLRAGRAMKPVEISAEIAAGNAF